MEIIRMRVGALSTNAYIVFDPERTDAVIVDPGGDADQIRQALKGRSIAAIMLTHGHCDHIQALEALRAGAVVAIHRLDARMLLTAAGNLSEMLGRGFACGAADRLVVDGERVEAAGLCFEVLHTPGHTPGSVCYRCGKELFSGDTLFRSGYGRCDLPGGDFAVLEQSLARLFRLEGVERVHPGHNEDTDLERERRRIR